MMDLVQLEIKEKGKVYGFGFFLYDVLDRFCKICEEVRKNRIYKKI